MLYLTLLCINSFFFMDTLSSFCNMIILFHDIYSSITVIYFGIYNLILLFSIFLFDYPLFLCVKKGRDGSSGKSSKYFLSYEFFILNMNGYVMYPCLVCRDFKGYAFMNGCLVSELVHRVCNFYLLPIVLVLTQNEPKGEIKTSILEFVSFSV
ncbi:hypothetical protein GIB67_041384 [Kingdonia uniflora]|uniref:Uncharacterized protein n=1 Tax=Kingdonia uniflora TaxID=39325 RepID=A0A7J7LRI3_9MAGN|nr:hypothetical protein GIB67_041384 [Kingdonia uniflora]